MSEVEIVRRVWEALPSGSQWRLRLASAWTLRT